MRYTVQEIQKIAGAIAARHGVERMFLFGSYARGDAGPDSDLDFRIDSGEIHGLFALGGLYADLEDAFGLMRISDTDSEIRIGIDLVTTGGLDRDFLERIAAEEILIYERPRKPEP